MKKLLPAALMLALSLLLVLAVVPALPGGAQAAAREVPITVFLFDPCGGCGMDNPGCGECKDTLRCHDEIKAQLGDALYDGSVTLRMFNCKLSANDDIYRAYLADFGETDKGFPALFIGEAADGFLLVGTQGLKTALDAYIM